MIKVSVIVPVYNVEKYLPKCLDSLVNQTLKDIEIIIVNDGSPDESDKIISRYAKKYKNIKAYAKENGGLSDARNFGLKKATGKYVAFIDSDDYIDKDMLKKMYEKAISKNLDIIVCDSVNVYENGNKVLIHSNLHYSDNVIRNYLISPPMACTRLYNIDLFNNLEFKKNIYYEDLELTPKLVNITTKIDFLEEGMYYYLQRTGSIMKQKEFNNRLLDIFTVLSSNKAVLEDKYPQEIEYMYITHLLRTATLRFLEYNNCKEYINRIHNEIKQNYPNWKKNTYYKKSSIKLRIICILAYYRQITLLKIIKKITNK